MKKAIQHTVAATFNGVVLGYYEQADKLQLASIAIESGIIRRCEIRDFWNLHEMLGYLIEQPRPLGIGIPAVLALSTGRQGWRAADYWLNESPYQTKSKYDEFPFYWGPYQMADQRSLSSIAMLCELRRRWPDHRADHHGGLVPLQSLSQPVHPRHRPGQHGLSRQVSTQVVGKCRGRVVPAGSIFLQRSHHDQFPGSLTTQPRWAVSPAFAVCA